MALPVCPLFWTIGNKYERNFVLISSLSNLDEFPEFLGTGPKKPGRPSSKSRTAKKLAAVGFSNPIDAPKNLLEACAADDDGSKILRAAIARGLGLTQAKAAEFSGLSERQVAYLSKDPGFMAVASWSARAQEAIGDFFEKVTVDSYKQDIEDLLSDCKRILKSALKTDDLSVALRAVKQIEDRIFGAPTQNIKQTNLGVQYNVIRLPESAIQAFSLTANEQRDLLGLPSAQEAELVSSEGE